MSTARYKNQLIPPPELAPSMPEESSAEQRVAAWVDLMNASEQFVLAGLAATLARMATCEPRTAVGMSDKCKSTMRQSRGC